MIVREKDDLAHWFKFFLTGIIETSKKGIITFDKILQLQKKVEEKIQALGRKTINAKKVIDYLYHRPRLDAEKVSEIAELSLPSSYNLISDLENLEILKEVTGKQRDRKYVFEQYLRLFR